MQQISYQNLVNEDSTLTPELFIHTARSYLGTRYRREGQGRCGTDCGQFPLMILRSFGVTDLTVAAYGNRPDGAAYKHVLDSVLAEVPKSDVTPGDIIGCEFRPGLGIQHIAIVTELEPELKVIHAIRPYGVVEQYLHGRYLRAWKHTYRMRHRLLVNSEQ